MSDDDRTRLWQRVVRPADADPIKALRTCLAEVRAAPGDAEARRRLRAVAAEQGLWDQLAVLLAEESATATDDEVAAALFEELADVHENLDQPFETIAAMERLVELDPDHALHHDRLARLYHRAGAWAKAAESFERVAALARDDRSRAALRAAARLYRDHGQPERAAAAYRAIVARRPTDLDVWRALDDLYVQLGRWREVAEVRGELAARIGDGVDKAAMLRAQARALEHIGDAAGAAELLAESAGLAPEAVSGLIDYAEVLASGGKGREAAELLSTRITDAIGIGAPAADVAALRLRLAQILDDDCGDRAGAEAVLDKLLAATPDYLPALEQLAAKAAGHADPRVHAAALLRYAEVVPDQATRAAVMVEAGRRLRAAGDRVESARVLDAACALAPGDADAAGERDAARAALAIERAVARAGQGEAGAAEAELRAVLAARPDDVDAALALGAVLADTGRLAECAEHLRATLAAGADAIPAEQRAVLVHRYATAVAAQGDADAAHQLLYEAHRLDRKNLIITLALGDSCHGRKLWREAGIHLGSLADHPDAALHGPAVAAGLVKAAQADVRALRPANAEKRMIAAARLDPGCAPAWHGLAEIATERGDLAGAAEHLEREATATTEPAAQLRLFEALGDLALDVLGDPVRAERCWSQVAGAGTTAVLDKLLVVQRRRGAGVERGETCLRLAALRDQPRARKDLMEEAAQAFAAGGDHARARTCIDQVILAHPLDVDTVACASAVALAAGDHEAAAGWLGRALTAWDGAGDRGDGDPRRAELWRRLGDARRGRGDDAGARTSYERAIATAPESDGAHAARRGLVELAGAGDRSVAGNLAELVAVEQDPADVLAWARECARAGDAAARPLFELATALGAAVGPDDAAAAGGPTRIMASDETYAATLDPAERRALVDDDADPPLAGVLEALTEAASLIWPSTKAALDWAGFADAERVSSASPAAVAALYPQIAKALDGPTTVVYATASATAPELTLLASSPPVVVVGPRLAAERAKSPRDGEAGASVPMAGRSGVLAGAPGDVGASGDSDAALRFRLGRIVELARDRRLFAVAAGGAGDARTQADRFARIVEILWQAFAPAADTDPDLKDEADRLRAAVPLLLRRRLGDMLAACGRAALDPAAYLAACDRAADRSGLLSCGHVGVAIELAGGAAAARHLVRLAASSRYHAARAALWSPLRR